MALAVQATSDALHEERLLTLLVLTLLSLPIGFFTISVTKR